MHGPAGGSADHPTVGEADDAPPETVSSPAASPTSGPSEAWRVGARPLPLSRRVRQGPAHSTTASPSPASNGRPAPPAPWGPVRLGGWPGRPGDPGHERVADPTVSVFARHYRAGFPIKEMRLVTTADLRPPTGDGNNTASLVCRTAPKQTRWSAHAYGLAVDVNPFQNPYQDRRLGLQRG